MLNLYYIFRGHLGFECKQNQIPWAWFCSCKVFECLLCMSWTCVFRLFIRWLLEDKQASWVAIKIPEGRYFYHSNEGLQGSFSPVFLGFCFTRWSFRCSRSLRCHHIILSILSVFTKSVPTSLLTALFQNSLPEIESQWKMAQFWRCQQCWRYYRQVLEGSCESLCTPSFITEAEQNLSLCHGMGETVGDSGLGLWMPAELPEYFSPNGITIGQKLLSDNILFL